MVPQTRGLLDVTERPELDYYLVLTGPASPAASSRGGTRPWCIESVYLFDSARLLSELRTRGVKIGVASSQVRLSRTQLVPFVEPVAGLVKASMWSRAHWLNGNAGRPVSRVTVSVTGSGCVAIAA